MDIDNICKQTSMTTIFVVLFVILSLCFVVSTKIGICVSIVFLVLFSMILYSRRDIKEGYEPVKTRMKGSNRYGGGYQQTEDDMNNEGGSYYVRRETYPEGTAPIPQPGILSEKFKKNPGSYIIDPEVKTVKTSYITTKGLDISGSRYSNTTCPKPVSIGCSKFLNDPTTISDQVVGKDLCSKNHMLQGGANPKTLIPPMIARPCYSIDWRDTTMVIPNIINGSNNENLYKSGYISSVDLETPEKSEEVVEHYSFTEHEPKHVEYAEKSWSNQIDMANGYGKMESGFPRNLPQGNCGKDKAFDEYNRRIFTQTVQPGVFYKNDIIEPINSNIGISFQQEFLPRTFKDVDNGMLIEDHDPNDAPNPPRIMKMQEPDIYNTYDPRFNGYGTSYRNYLDPVTGKAKYPYDDINAVKMPNYIVRSKIDTHNFGDMYGAMQNTGLSLNEIRKMAEKSFIDDTTAFRDDITSKLMRKTNSEMWQRRVAPISKARRMLGGR